MAPFAQETRRRGLGVVALLVLLALSPSLLTFPAAWLENRVHAFALAGLALWLLFRVRNRVVTAESGSPLIIVPLALASLGWAAGFILNIQLLHQGMVPVLLLVWWYAIAGREGALEVLPAALLIALASPIWGVLVRPLQSLTVVANSMLLSVARIDADITGDYIAIPAGVFEVARGCSGANYFESGVIISTIYALVFLTQWRARVRAIAVGALLAAVANWLRVFGLIVIGQVTEMKSPLIKEHNGYGWVVFAIVMAGYFLLARRFERYDDALSRAIPLEAAKHAALPASGLAITLPTLAVLCGPLLVALGQFRAPATAEDVVAHPPGVAAHTAFRLVPQQAELARWTPTYQGYDGKSISLLIRAPDTVQLDRFVYLRQAQGKEMIGALNKLAADSLQRGGGLVGPLDVRGRMANATLLQLGDDRWLAWQWYHVGEVETHSATEAKMLELFSWFSTRSPAEIIVLSTRCEDHDCRSANARLYRAVTGKAPPAALSP